MVQARIKVFEGVRVTSRTFFARLLLSFLDGTMQNAYSFVPILVPDSTLFAFDMATVS